MKHELNGVHDVQRPTGHHQGNTSHEMHTRRPVPQLSSRATQFLLGQRQDFIVLAGLRSLKQSGNFH